ncbi:CD209 antigen-like protein A isoform 2-T2 [Anomaloglossus baeobatrachus]
MENEEITMNNCNKRDVYMNMHELKGGKPDKSVKDKNPKNKTVSTSNTKLLAALIILIIMFLILSIITGLLFKYYLAINEEMSELKNHDLAMNKEMSLLQNQNLAMNKEMSLLQNQTNDRQQTVLEDVNTVKKDLENVKLNFLQETKNINKTMEILCRTCPPGWKSIGVFCYYFSKDTLPWDNAKDDCIQKGSTLLILRNMEELDSLKSSFGDNTYWIGLRRDKEDPAKWNWLDGSVLSFRNWNKGEPNNHNTEDCVESSGNWNDLSCSSKMKYVCKKGCCCC